MSPDDHAEVLRQRTDAISTLLSIKHYLEKSDQEDAKLAVKWASDCLERINGKVE